MDKLNTGPSIQTRDQPYMVKVINSCTGIPGAGRWLGSGAEVALALRQARREHGLHRLASRCGCSFGSDVVVDPVEPLRSRLARTTVPKLPTGRPNARSRRIGWPGRSGKPSRLDGGIVIVASTH
jgi:hypothetical protein